MYINFGFEKIPTVPYDNSAVELKNAENTPHSKSLK